MNEQAKNTQRGSVLLLAVSLILGLMATHGLVVFFNDLFTNDWQAIAERGMTANVVVSLFVFSLILSLAFLLAAISGLVFWRKPAKHKIVLIMGAILLVAVLILTGAETAKAIVESRSSGGNYYLIKQFIYSLLCLALSSLYLVGGMQNRKLAKADGTSTFHNPSQPA